MKTILVAGANSGIGRALIDKLLTNHRVIALSRNPLDLNHPNLVYHTYDALSEADTLPELEQLDGVVYCPGSITLKPFHRLKKEEFQSDWELNFMGAVRVLQQAYPVLRQSSHASVVLFSTVAVQKGMAFHASISAAKAAIEGLTRSLAAEWAPQIRVNAIAPSLTETPLASGLLNTEAKAQASAERHPLKRIGKPEEIAAMAAFLLGDEASWMTGQVVHLDGGLSM